MKFISFLYASLFTLALNASALLVPEESITFDHYRTICEKNSYSCFPESFALILSYDLNVYHKIIDDFDLDNKAYVSTFNENVLFSLKNENLSYENFLSLQLAVKKMSLYFPQNKQFKNLIDLLQEIQFLTEENLDPLNFSPSEKSYIFLAGRLIADNGANFVKNKKIQNLVKFYVVKYNSFSTDSFNSHKFYLTGQCETPIYTPLILQNYSEQRIPLFKQGCNFDQQYTWGKNLVSEHFKQNKTKYLWGIGLTVGLILLNKYDVIISF